MAGKNHHCGTRRLHPQCRLYDLGFKREAGRYALVGDWYGIKDINQDALTQALTQRYAYRATVQKLVEEQGFSLVEEQQQQQTGVIHLVLRRTAYLFTLPTNMDSLTAKTPSSPRWHC